MLIMLIMLIMHGYKLNLYLCVMCFSEGFERNWHLLQLETLRLSQTKYLKELILLCGFIYNRVFNLIKQFSSNNETFMENA